jgi:hypothetical protein
MEARRGRELRLGVAEWGQVLDTVGRQVEEVQSRMRDVERNMR